MAFVVTGDTPRTTAEAVDQPRAGFQDGKAGAKFGTMSRSIEVKPDNASPIKATLLCVDADADSLASLGNLLTTAGYRVLLANNGAAALAFLDVETVEIVISDMRLPKMTGAHFLQQVRERWPHPLRFLLTGQAELTSIIDAINHGQVSRTIAKPWVEADLLALVDDALQQQAAHREQRLVAELAKVRSEELNALNSILQNNVSNSLEELSAANERLKENLVVTLKVFASLIETRDEHLAGHSRRVANLVRQLATRLGLDAALVREVFFAALLHDLGKLGFSDEMLSTPLSAMSVRQVRDYREHPVRAEQLLMPLQDLRGAAATVGAQLERVDGTGFPNQLKGRAILVGARILAVCSDFDKLQIGLLVPRKLTPKEAQLVIVAGSGKRYDPWVVDEFVRMLDRDTADTVASAASEPGEMIVGASALVGGMVLARDLIGPSGVMMLSAGHPLDMRLIQKIAHFEKSIDGGLTIYVRAP